MASEAAAIIRSGSGVKSTVTSTRFPRGRTPTPVLSRFEASSMTGTAQDVGQKQRRLAEAGFGRAGSLRHGDIEMLGKSLQPQRDAVFRLPRIQLRAQEIDLLPKRAPARAQQPRSSSMMGVATSMTPVSK